MKISTNTSKMIPMVLALTYFAILFTVCLSSCNQTDLSQPISPTLAGTNADSNGAATKKEKKVSGVNPMVPYFNEGGRWTASFWLFNKYLPEDVHKGKYLVLVGEYSGISLSTLYTKYCFRRAVCGDYQIQDFVTAGFSENQILISIGWRNDDRTAWQVFWGTGTVGYGMPAHWQDNAPNYAQKVLGFWMDEPSGLISADSIKKISNVIHSDGSRLWIEDYDTSPIPSSQDLGIPHNYHIWDKSMLNNADYISCNGNTSSWVSGANFFGDNVLIIDYVEFYGAFGSKFCAIECQPMDGSGALMNDATMYNWMINYPNVNNFAYYIGTGNAKISDGDVNARLAGLSNFMNDAASAGFLGTENELYNYLYVCQQNNVIFTPPGPAGSYYGVWNGSRYTGPVDPNTQGAVLCWMLVSTTPTGQIQDIY